MSVSDLPADRRVAGARLARLLGAWQRGGPAYTALADALRAAVLSGTVPLSTRLPGERELAEALGVSRTTATAAYSLLRDEGYLVSRRGSGTVTTLPTAPGARSPMPGPCGADESVADLSAAAPSAPSALHGAYLAALDALPRYLAGTGYAPLGVPVLRAAVARWYEERGTPTSPDQILVTTGAQEAIHLLVAAHAGPGDRVVVEQPTYPHAIDVVRSVGARAVPVPCGRDGLDVDLLESTVRQVAPRLVYLISDYRNPTGTSLTPEQRTLVRDLARRHRTTVVGDEVLRELTIDGDPPESFPGDGTSSGVVVTIGSASKSFWGGLRIGWVRAHPDLVSRLASVRAHVDIGTPPLEQLVVAELISGADAVLTARRRVLRERRDLAVGLLREHLPTWDVPVPAGGLSLWADLGAPVSSALAASALRHGVRIAPGPTFGVDGGLEDHLRVPFAATPEVLRRGVEGLAAAWHDLGSVTWEPAAPVRAVV